MINTTKFKVIAHRGLLHGPSIELENNIENIENNIKKYPYIINELDIWLDSDLIYIGHNEAARQIDLDILSNYSKNLILHIKGINFESIKSIYLLKSIGEKFHFFSHQDDDFTITNHGWVWSHPKKGFVKNTICVLPEEVMSLDLAVNQFEFKQLYGVCSDYPLELLDLMKSI